MNDSDHEILPSPQLAPPESTGTAPVSPEYTQPTEVSSQPENETSKAIEQNTFGPAPQQPQPPSAQSFDGATATGASNTTDQGQAGAQSTPMQVPEEKDNIDQAWIDRIQGVVDQTKNDPHARNQAISRLRADYMKQKYNKDIKLVKE